MKQKHKGLSSRLSIIENTFRHPNRSMVKHCFPKSLFTLYFSLFIRSKEAS